MGRGRGRGAARGTRGRPRGRGRGRRAVKTIESDEEEIEEISENDAPVPDVKPEETAKETNTEDPKPPTPPAPQSFDLEADISQLQAPTFTTLNRGPPEPMLRLNWDLPVNLIGQKVINPMIYCCDKCIKPILIYGRLIPCKHVFCLGCAKREMDKCPRCNDKVIRVEQTGLGNIFICTHGGSRYGNDGCRRTYLSQRDLQAHINHRHLRLTNVVDKEPQKTATVQTGLSHIQTVTGLGSSTVHHSANQVGSRMSSFGTQQGSISSSRSNLVPVPIQETPTSSAMSYHYLPPPNTSANTYGFPYGTQTYTTQSFFPGSTTTFPNLQQPPPQLPPPIQFDATQQPYTQQQWNQSGSNYFR